MKEESIVFSVSAENDGFGHFSRLGEFVGVTAPYPAFAIIDTTKGSIEKFIMKD